MSTTQSIRYSLFKLMLKTQGLAIMKLQNFITWLESEKCFFGILIDRVGKPFSDEEWTN